MTDGRSGSHSETMYFGGIVYKTYYAQDMCMKGDYDA